MVALQGPSRSATKFVPPGPRQERGHEMLPLVFCGRPWYAPQKASELGAAIVLLFQARLLLLSLRNELFAFRTFHFFIALGTGSVPFSVLAASGQCCILFRTAPVTGKHSRVTRGPRYLCSIARSAAAAAADLCSPFVDDTSCRAPRVKTMLFCAASFLLPLLAERALFFH